jgi:hypothetical protein
MNIFAGSLQDFNLSVPVLWLCWRQSSQNAQTNKIAFKGQMNSFAA